MIKKDLRYIIRRVIVTIIVALIFYLFRTLTANALEVTDLDINGAYNVGSTYSFNLTYMNNPTSYMFDFPNNFNDTTTNYIVFQYSDSIMNEQEISFSPSGSYNFNLFLNAINFGSELFFTDGSSVLCDRKSGYIICQKPANKIVDQIRFNFLGALVPNGSLAGVSGSQLTHYTMYISNWIILYKNKPDNSSSIISNNNQNTQSIINSQQQQTQDIINSQQQQTQDIINSQQQQTQDTINSQKVCKKIDKNTGKYNGYLNNTGQLIENTTVVTTDYIKLDNTATIKILDQGRDLYFCSYDINKTIISCVDLSNKVTGDYLTIPLNTTYGRFSIYKTQNSPQYELCKNGNQVISEQQEQINDTLTDSSIDTGGGAGHYFGDNEFKKEYGLSDFVLIPINFIRNLNGNVCNAITVPIPFTEQSFILPCMRAILTDKFSDFITLYQTIISGVIIFKCLVGCYSDIQRAMDPDEQLTVTEMFT